MSRFFKASEKQIQPSKAEWFRVEAIKVKKGDYIISHGPVKKIEYTPAEVHLIFHDDSSKVLKYSDIVYVKF